MKQRKGGREIYQCRDYVLIVDVMLQYNLSMSWITYCQHKYMAILVYVKKGYMTSVWLILFDQFHRKVHFEETTQVECVDLIPFVHRQPKILQFLIGLHRLNIFVCESLPNFFNVNNINLLWHDLLYLSNTMFHRIYIPAATDRQHFQFLLFFVGWTMIILCLWSPFLTCLRCPLLDLWPNHIRL